MSTEYHANAVQPSCLIDRWIQQDADTPVCCCFSPVLIVGDVKHGQESALRRSTFLQRKHAFPSRKTRDSVIESPTFAHGFEGTEQRRLKNTQTYDLTRLLKYNGVEEPFYDDSSVARSIPSHGIGNRSNRVQFSSTSRRQYLSSSQNDTERSTLPFSPQHHEKPTFYHRHPVVSKIDIAKHFVPPENHRITSNQWPATSQPASALTPCFTKPPAAVASSVVNFSEFCFSSPEAAAAAANARLAYISHSASLPPVIHGTKVQTRPLTVPESSPR